MKCHICESETDFCCEICGEPVCEDCCVVPTYMNQLDYALCTDCDGERECRRSEQAAREYEQEEKTRLEKERRSAARKATYWKPENIAKRRERKAERKRLKAQQARERMAQAMKIVSDMFREM